MCIYDVHVYIMYMYGSKAPYQMFKDLRTDSKEMINSTDSTTSSVCIQGLHSDVSHTPETCEKRVRNV